MLHDKATLLRGLTCLCGIYIVVSRNNSRQNSPWDGAGSTAIPRSTMLYMSAHVLLNLLNELRKRDKMRGLSSILSLLRNEFNKFNTTGAQMFDFIIT